MDDWKQIIERNCEGIDLEALRNLPYSERKILMEKYNSYFSNSYKSFFEFINDFSKSRIRIDAG